MENLSFIQLSASYKSCLADNDYYQDLSELSLEAYERCVPLLIAVNILSSIDGNRVFRSVILLYTLPLSIKLKHLAMAGCVFYNSRKWITPLDLGLAI